MEPYTQAQASRGGPRDTLSQEEGWAQPPKIPATPGHSRVSGSWISVSKSLILSAPLAGQVGWVPCSGAVQEKGSGPHRTLGTLYCWKSWQKQEEDGGGDAGVHHYFECLSFLRQGLSV